MSSPCMTGVRIAAHLARLLIAADPARKRARLATCRRGKLIIRSRLGTVQTLDTDRLALREMTDADLDDIAALLGDEQVMRYYPRPKTRDEAARWISWNRRLYAEHGFGLWAIRLIDSGEFVGECGLTIQVVDGVEEVEVGLSRGCRTDRAATGEACADVRRGPDDLRNSGRGIRQDRCREGVDGVHHGVHAHGVIQVERVLRTRQFEIDERAS